MEHEILMLNRLLEDKQNLIEDLTIRRKALDAMCDAVTQTFERDLQFEDEVVQIEIEPIVAEDQEQSQMYMSSRK